MNEIPLSAEVTRSGRLLRRAERAAEVRATRYMAQMNSAPDEESYDRLADLFIDEVIQAAEAQAERVARRNDRLAWWLGIIWVLWSLFVAALAWTGRADMVVWAAPLAGAVFGAWCAIMLARWQAQPASPRRARSVRRRRARARA